jgi:hypothetical protein
MRSARKGPSLFPKRSNPLLNETHRHRLPSATAKSPCWKDDATKRPISTGMPSE